MRILLQRSEQLTYGQDYHCAALASSASFELVQASKDDVDSLLRTEGNPSLIVTFNSDQPEDARLAERFPSVPLVVHLHVRPSYLDSVRRERTESMLARATKIVVPARFLKEQLIATRSPSVIACVRNGIDMQALTPPTREEASAFRARFEIPESAVVLSYVGRLTKAKGFQILKVIAENLPCDSYMVVRSTRDDSENLAKLTSINPVQIRTEIECGQDRSSLPLRFSDIHLVTSLCEVAPMVSLEALACGTRILSTDCTAFYQELYEEGVTPHDLSLVTLPDGLTDRDRAVLVIQEAEADTIAKAMIRKIMEYGFLEGEQRYAVRRRAEALGIDVSEMLSVFSVIHDEAASA